MNPIRRSLGRSIEIVTGRFRHPQDHLAQRMHERVARLEGSEQIRPLVGFVHQQSQIVARHLELELDEIDERRDWMRLVNDATRSLATRSLRALLSRGPSAKAYDGLVVVSSTYYGFPSLSRLLLAEMELDPQVKCFDLGGLGCAGPTHGLHVADLLVQSGTCRCVAVVCVDAMGTHSEARRHAVVPTMSQIVAHCLASDAAAALRVSADDIGEPEESLLFWHSSRLFSEQWPDSLEENDLTADAGNQPLISVGKGIRTRIESELVPRLADVDPRATFFHPGGAALVAKLSRARPDLAATLHISERILIEHGNVGAASVLLVLARALDDGYRAEGRLNLVALGPGIVSTMLELRGD